MYDATFRAGDHDVDALERSDVTRSRLSADAALLCIGALTLVGVVAYVPFLLPFFRGMVSEQYPLEVISVDFANYWMAGQMTVAGKQQDLFYFPIYFSHLQATFGADYPIHNWGYPPHFLLLLWPLGFIAYKPALVVFLGVTFALFVYAVLEFHRAYTPRSDAKVLVLALLGFALMMVYTTQNGFLTGALLLLGLAWMKSRPVLAGLAFALLTIKPQLGLLIPVLLLLDRNWRTIVWSVAFALALAALSAALFGMQSWHAFITETMAYQRSVMTDWDGIFLRMMPTAFASVRTLGYSPELAYLVQWPVSIAGGALVLWAWRQQSDPLQRIFTLACGTFVISPYAFNYDMGALTAIAAMLVGSRPMSRLAVVSVSVVAALAASVTNLGRSNVPISPLLLALAVVMVAWEARQSNNATAVREEQLPA